MNYSFNQSVSITTPALPPVEERLQTLVEAMKTLAELTGGRLDPELEQHFLDYATNLLAQHNRQHSNKSVTKKLHLLHYR
jgi:HD-GYP domain-containing protein (c-di-GMP phosphodiesterase class II)